ncbi:MAG: hypothetical protein JWM99_156 [Verrucomicrobiales bacterium]|jgi:hypothetical protein|nr:hypothetical protein [Verrucomicrobiales bacterium]
MTFLTLGLNWRTGVLASGAIAPNALLARRLESAKEPKPTEQRRNISRLENAEFKLEKGALFFIAILLDVNEFFEIEQ